MAPHKHSRASPRKPKLEQLKADHELFLQAFEKPTQIYRFLAARQKILPIFLHRTLTYMRTSDRPKKDFSVDSLLEMKENKMKAGRQVGSHSGKYLTITFNQLTWKGMDICEKATVELVLLKVCHKRRKDICQPVMRMSLGQCDIPANPTPDTSSETTPPQVLTIPSSCFSHNNGHTVRSYRLLIQVHCSTPPPLPAVPNGSLCNGDMDSDSSEGQAAKRRKVMTRQHDKEQDTMGTSPLPGQQESGDDDRVISFASELVVVDKQNKCQLLDGSYELTLQEVQPKINSKYQTSSWETISDGKCIGPMEVSDSCPRLSFSLTWSKVEEGGDAEVTLRSPERSSRSGSNHTSQLDRSLSLSPDQTKHSALSNGDNAVTNRTASPPAQRIRPSASNSCSPSKTPTSSSKSCPVEGGGNRVAGDESEVDHVFYQFLYNNNTRQQTEARNNLRCPWCAVNCQRLYSLLKHLTTCHNRFTFTYVPHHKNARIDVAINEHYDGSYSGNPQNLITSHMGYAFQRNGPCRRTPVTQILVMKPVRPKESLLEFQEGENSDYLTQRPYISGHNRTYYHTHSLQPIRPQEMDEDSEDEIDPDWIRERTRMMIDEFTDVNEGEKDLMKLWNSHCMRYNFIADSQIPRACSLFIEEHGALIVRENLVRNFLLHLINLYDFSLLHPQLIPRFMDRVHRIGRLHGYTVQGVASAASADGEDVDGGSVRGSEGAERGDDGDEGPPVLYPQQILQDAVEDEDEDVNSGIFPLDGNDQADALDRLGAPSGDAAPASIIKGEKDEQPFVMHSKTAPDITSNFRAAIENKIQN